MQLPDSLRDSLLDELENFLDGSTPDAESVTVYLLDLLETWADDVGMEDVVASLEESGTLEGSLQDALESELSSDDAFDHTNEDIVGILEKLCGVEWVDDEEFESSLDDDEDEEPGDETVDA